MARKGKEGTKPAASQSPVDAMLGEVRRVMASYASRIDEREMYEALCDEAAGWEMRLEELQLEAGWLLTGGGRRGGRKR